MAEIKKLEPTEFSEARKEAVAETIAKENKEVTEVTKKEKKSLSYKVTCIKCKREIYSNPERAKKLAGQEYICRDCRKQK